MHLNPAIGTCGMMRMDRRHGMRRVRQFTLPGRPCTVTNRVLCRVLIIDDNADLAEATSMMLSICGFDTSTAYSGSLAVEKARTFRPDIILLDIGLPDMDGYEVASTIRRECNLGTTMFIAVSARDPDARAPHAREARFDHYLIKPVDLDLLLRLLSRQDP